MNITGFEMRWYKGVDDDGFKLQFRYFYDHADGSSDETHWTDIPHILEGVGEI